MWPNPRIARIHDDPLDRLDRLLRRLDRSVLDVHAASGRFLLFSGLWIEVWSSGRRVRLSRSLRVAVTLSSALRPAGGSRSHPNKASEVPGAVAVIRESDGK